MKHDAKCVPLSVGLEGAVHSFLYAKWVCLLPLVPPFPSSFELNSQSLFECHIEVNSRLKGYSGSGYASCSTTQFT